MTWPLLIVDDDDDVRDMLSCVLETRGFRVLGARNGRHAFDVVVAGGSRPAAIILDLNMPVMNGEAFLAQQPDEPLLAQVPVVLLTAELDVPPLPPTVQVVLHKPASLPELITILRRLCDTAAELSAEIALLEPASAPRAWCTAREIASRRRRGAPDR